MADPLKRIMNKIDKIHFPDTQMSCIDGKGHEPDEYKPTFKPLKGNPSISMWDDAIYCKKCKMPYIFNFSKGCLMTIDRKHTEKRSNNGRFKQIECTTCGRCISAPIETEPFEL